MAARLYKADPSQFFLHLHNLRMNVYRCARLVLIIYDLSCLSLVLLLTLDEVLHGEHRFFAKI
ncbi:hypothetical protein DAEQUDRAFT_732372 [Daedalea quercina L-15889]|uniref:Uncharacterized protein n=1 Tax=Daedalea quercina L-15889 TaxID=1314783 RepID=A0A165LNT6_9APHY|nr:hypothetical protein DAEQUDRAFT_732372 [Daedalea quercina L-15889]